MYGGVHPREVGAPHGPRIVARDIPRDGVRKKQLLDHDHDIIRLTGCVSQPLILCSVPLWSACWPGGLGAVWATVEAHHLPQAAAVEDRQLCFFTNGPF